MGADISFELVLLDRMSESYRKLVLDRAGLTEEQANEIRRHSPLQYPAIFMKPIESFDGVLDAAPSELFQQIDRRSSQFEEAEPHLFLLGLWPQLLWVVHAGANGITWGGEFQPKTTAHSGSFNPADLQPGLWCRHTLERIADGSSIIDGWDEHVVLHLQFSGQSYEGEFIFGLLQSWKKSNA
jgi:hypothetical protein